MERKRKHLIVGAGILAFLAFKLCFLTLFFGDSNAYFYMAKVVLQGLMPYRDFFLADPPLMVYILAFLRIFFGNNLLAYQFLPVVLESCTAFILFLLLDKEDNKFSFLAPFIYLFSLSVLATSDYLTGAQFVILFSLFGIFLWKKQKPFWSGVLWALACLIKLYAAPAFLGFLIFVLLQKNRKQSAKFIFGFVLAGVLIMAPFLIVSFHNVIAYTLTHQFNRPAGLSKINVFGFLLSHEWLLLILAIGGLIASRKKEYFYPFIFSLVFFILYQDIYYTYFDSFFAYIIIFAILFLGWLWEKNRGLCYAFFGIYIVFFLISFGFYQQTSFIQDRFTNAREVSDYMKTLPLKYEIYGVHEAAPVVALLSERKLFNNYIDTNGQAFASGGQNLQKVSQDAAKAGVVLIARIIDLPEYNIKDFGYEAYFAKDVFEKYCQRMKAFPSASNDQYNFIVLYKCDSILKTGG
jgi:hypothetical protein